MTRRAAVGTLAATAAVLVVTAAPATASCAAVDPAGSPVVFVGTALQERNGFTRLAVDEVWAGPDLASRAWVRTGQQQLDPDLVVMGSNDAHLEPGERYVVGATSHFSAAGCSIVPVDEATRPAVVRHPVVGGSSGVVPVDPLVADGPGSGTRAALGVGGGAGAGALAAALLLLVRRRRARVGVGRR